MFLNVSTAGFNFSSASFPFFNYRRLLSGNSSFSPSVSTELSTLAPFLVREWLSECGNCLGTHQFASVPVNGQHRFVYDPRHGANRAPAAGF